MVRVGYLIHSLMFLTNKLGHDFDNSFLLTWMKVKIEDDLSS